MNADELLVHVEQCFQAAIDQLGAAQQAIVEAPTECFSGSFEYDMFLTYSVNADGYRREMQKVLKSIQAARTARARKGGDGLTHVVSDSDPRA